VVVEMVVVGRRHGREKEEEQVGSKERGRTLARVGLLEDARDVLPKERGEEPQLPQTRGAVLDVHGQHLEKTPVAVLVEQPAVRPAGPRHAQALFCFVCFVCLFCLFVLFVCLFVCFVCLFCLFVLSVCFVCLFCLFVLSVCLFVCLWYTFVTSCHQLVSRQASTPSHHFWDQQTSHHCNVEVNLGDDAVGD
jgi:hypothetical protein